MKAHGVSFDDCSNPSEGRKATPSAHRRLKKREQGQWSFLTWSFFLSQVLAAEQAAAAAARSAELSDETGTQEDVTSAADRLPGAVVPLPEVTALEGENRTGAAAPSAVIETPSPDQPTLAPMGFGGEAEPDWALRVSVGSHSASVALQSSDQEAAEFLGQSPPAAADQAAADPITEPAAGIAGSVLAALDPVVDGAVIPVLDLVGDVLGGVITPVGDILADTLAIVVTPVGDLLGDTLGSVVTPVGDLLGDTLGSVVTPVDDLLGDTLASVVTPIGDNVASPLADSLSGSLNTLLGLAADNEQPVAEQVLATGSGSLDFEVAPLIGLQADGLFTSGVGYTQYGLSLQVTADAETGTSPGLPGDLVETAADVLTAPVGTGPSDEGSAVSSIVPVNLPTLLGDIGLHGLGL